MTQIPTPARAAVPARGPCDASGMQHATMLVHLHALDGALPIWRAGGREGDAIPVPEALTGIDATLPVRLVWRTCGRSRYEAGRAALTRR